MDMHQNSGKSGLRIPSSHYKRRPTPQRGNCHRGSLFPPHNDIFNAMTVEFYRYTCGSPERFLRTSLHMFLVENVQLKV